MAKSLRKLGARHGVGKTIVDSGSCLLHFFFFLKLSYCIDSIGRVRVDLGKPVSARLPSAYTVKLVLLVSVQDKMFLQVYEHAQVIDSMSKCSILVMFHTRCIYTSK